MSYGWIENRMFKYLRIFGSHATFLRKEPGISKFDLKGETAILVGYSSEAKAYRSLVSHKGY